MKKFYDVKLKISARHREDDAEYRKIEENTDCVNFDSSSLRIITYDRLFGDTYSPKNVYQFPRGDIFTIEIEFKP